MKRFLASLIVAILALSFVACDRYFLPYRRVTFDAGELATYDSVLVVHGGNVDLPTPDVEGYTFKGWYYDESFSLRFYDTDPVTKDLTLYARLEIEVVTPTQNATYAAVDGGYKLTSYTPTTHIASLPASFEGEPVVAIGSEVFGDLAESVSVIEIPEGVQTIDRRAFAGCRYLEYLYVPASVLSVGDELLSGGSMIKYIEFAGDPTVTGLTFSGIPFWGTAILTAEDSHVARLVESAEHSAYPDGPVNYGRLVPREILDEPVQTAQFNAHVTAGEAQTRSFAIDERPESRPVLCSEGLLDVVRLGYQPTFAAQGSDAAALYATVRDVLSRICTDDMTAADKAHAIYDWITARTTYDHAIVVDIGDSNVNWFHASYFLEGVFANGLAVCDGYAKAFELMCAIEGVDCVRIVGDYNGGAHAWNKLRLGQHWYHVDATFGDSASVTALDGELTDHDYLFDSDKVGYNEAAPYVYYEATDSAFDFWRYHTVGTAEVDGETVTYDARIDSTDELAAYVSYHKSDLASGKVLQLWVTVEIGDTVTALARAINNAGFNANNYTYFSALFVNDDSTINRKINGPVYIVPTALVEEKAA